MRRHLFRRPWVSALMILGFWSFIGDTRIEDSSGSSVLRPYEDNSEGLPQIGGRSLVSLPLEGKGNTALIAAWDGKIHLVDSNSMKIIWSFTSGPPIYSSYQASIKHDHSKETASISSTPYFFDYGEDWELYMHTEHGKMKLPSTIDEIVSSMPYISEDGAVMTGSKQTTVFEIDPITGELIRNHTSDIPSSGLTDSVFNSSKLKNNENIKDLIEPGLMNPIEPRLYIKRTDYSLKSYFSGSEKVSWSLSVAEIGATVFCPEIGNPTHSAASNLENNSSFEVDFGSAMSLSCQSKALVFRERNHVRSEPSGYNRLSGVYTTDNVLLMPTSNLMLPSHSNVDKHSNLHPEKLMLPGPAALPMPLTKINDSKILNVDLLSRLSNGSVWRPFVLFITMLVGLVSYSWLLIVKVKKNFLKDKPTDISDSKIVSLKRKKARKSGRSNRDYEKKEVSILSENEEMLTLSNGDVNNWFHHNDQNDISANGHKIGNLLVSDMEIAKGSDGTIVLEGIYLGRQVAVKRLVKSHHDVAFKEVQNLIASDLHPNIVRWYGVEYDKDFIYLSLERCTCSLDDLIQICYDPSTNSMFIQDQDAGPVIDYKVHLESVKNVMPPLNLWNENSRPSPLLLKLMRDVVAGLEHLHELGIIHRDLKPQNVLIVKQPYVCAKLSDMGISKCLPADMSSLGYRATGAGSPGWQAPEQLLCGRQTRAIDLFSLGCVLFFCITGGRHPFGDLLERDFNISRNQMDLFLVEDIPEAFDLIYRLLNPDPDLRPKASEVLKHPLFWSSEIRLSFLRDTSDRVELEDRENSDLLKALENTASLTFSGKWDEKIDQAFMKDIGNGRFRRYRYDSVRDLLRALRNKFSHYRELPQEIQELVGSVPEGYDAYFACRFPRLLIEVYKVVKQFCSEEERFQKYFKNEDEWTLIPERKFGRKS